jgi:Zn-dependent peptidase ImmA (M78 family)
MSRLIVNINPKILKWARTESGYSVKEISQKISSDNYERWENEGKNIPFGKLKRLASYYKRQIAVFFLENVPEKSKKPKDFRNLSPAKSQLSKKTLLALRRTNRFQKFAHEIEGEAYWKNKYSWLEELKNISNEQNNLADWLRSKLEVSIDEQIQWKSSNETYRNWRNIIEEKLGILVFQFPMSMDEIQGFCVTDKIPYSIVTNSSHSYYGRVFTLFHELGHILRHTSGMCLMDFTNTQTKIEEEFECNSFAAEFLIPSNTIIETKNLSDIKKYSNILGVSREVYLRRMKDLKHINDLSFFSLLEDIKSTYKEKKKQVKVIIKPEVKSRAQRGNTFYNLVFDALDKKKINYSDASSALGLRINRLVNEFE